MEDEEPPAHPWCSPSTIHPHPAAPQHSQHMQQLQTHWPSYAASAYGALYAERQGPAYLEHPAPAYYEQPESANDEYPAPVYGEHSEPTYVDIFASAFVVDLSG